MPRLLPILVAFFFALFSGGVAHAAPTVTFTVGDSPQLVDGRPLQTNSILIRLQISSPIEVATTVVTVEGTSSTLTGAPTSASLSLPELARGVHSVSVVVTDALGGQTTTSREFYLNHAPRLSINLINGHIARGASLAVHVTCEDDSGPCSWLQVGGSPDGPVEGDMTKRCGSA